MNLGFVIKRAILSEKAYKDMEVAIYSFLVDERASKDDIKKAVENQFAVNVQKVNVNSVSAKSKRVTGTRKTTSVGGGKKARVYLVKGQNIALLSPKSEKKEKKEKATKTTTASQASKGEEKKGLLSKIKKAKEVEEEKK